MEKNNPAVVLVDDESDLLWVVGDALEEEGYRVVTVDHPDVVVDLTVEESPTVFVIDLLLPEHDGIELARRLRSEGLERVPMIAISGSDEMLQRAEESELFACVLRKPFEMPELVDSVRECVRALRA